MWPRYLSPASCTQERGFVPLSAPSRPRALLLAETCNPAWASLPVVGFKYARALAEFVNITIVTHIRNKNDFEANGELLDCTVFIDTEWLARPMYKMANALRGGRQVAWSINLMMAYPPYVAFEWQALRRFRKELNVGAFDLVHRITPMSPTLPSYMSGRVRQPFIIGPLNGNLDWPAAFAAEQKREKEGLRKLRNAYKHLPFVRSSYRNADCVMAAFNHTIADMDAVEPGRIVSFPEVGFDPELFNDMGRRAPFSGDGQKHFLYVGRMVPYKVPEVAIRAFLSSDTLAPHVLHMVGDGPELPRLQQIVHDAGGGDRVIFEGRKTQGEVAEFMRRSDAFVFPSIRELGAGVVVEAMASGNVCIVTDYGAPGDLVSHGRGIRVPLGTIDDLVAGYRAAMEDCLERPDAHADMARTARNYVFDAYTWEAKARYTAEIYDAVLAGAPLDSFTTYN
jgi:glycosyltransferase involved in cell wall biosynthesis